jgi:hypothetical protein
LSETFGYFIYFARIKELLFDLERLARNQVPSLQQQLEPFLHLKLMLLQLLQLLLWLEL